MTEKVWPSVGMKCVCVESADYIARVAAIRPEANLPVERGIYTIRSIISGSDGTPHLRFHEIHNKPMRSTVGKVEWGFQPKHFRQLITKKQSEDVRMFKSLLLDMPLTERIDRIGELLND